MRCGTWLKLFCVLALLPLAGRPAPAIAQPSSCVAETEPNNDPATAIELPSTEACIDGSIEGSGDQDIFVWTLSKADAKDRWTFDMSGIPGQQAIVKIVTLTFAADGVTVETVNDVAQFTSTDFNEPATATDLILPPGTYDVGVSASGDGDYHFAITRGNPLPASGDAEPNDGNETASPLAGPFEISGDLQDSEDWYAWTLSDEDATHDWTLSLNGLATSPPSLTIADESGAVILNNTSALALGQLSLEDIGLDAGTYFLQVAYSRNQPAPYVLSAVATVPRAANQEEEPNEQPETADRYDPTTPYKGRLTAGQDTDYLVFTVDDALSEKLFDLKLFWKAKGVERTVCLVSFLDGSQQDLVCQRGTQGVSLSNLRLPPGDIYVRIQGDPVAGDSYLLRLDSTSAFDPTFETEPNDNQTLATPLDSTQPISGRFGVNDDDFFKIIVTGEPQLWQVDLTGEAIGNLDYINAAGEGVLDARAGENGDPTVATLWDVFLVPGEHWFRATGASGDYTITMTPLGPPDPNSEREPNGDTSRAPALNIGGVKSGRLPSPSDIDTYRFSLAAPEHIRINVKSPADGGETLRLTWGPNQIVADTASAEAGQPVIYEAFLQPGDYAIYLQATQPSQSPYEISLERDDPFILPEDREPNNEAWQAGPLPADLSVSGNVSSLSDDDWYSIPAQSQGGTITVTLNAEPGTMSPYLYDDTATDLGLVADTSLSTFTATIPANTPLSLQLHGEGAYSFAVSFGGQSASTHGIPEAASVAGDAIKLTLTPKEQAVAAYWTEGQRVDADLAITNTSAHAVQLGLDAVTSDFSWAVELAESSITVGAGQTANVPVTIRVQPDARAGQPVRVTVRATAESGDFTTGWAEIEVDRDALPAHPERAWSVPDALLGGLNVAATALGAVPISSTDGKSPEDVAILFDGMSLPDYGYQTDAGNLPLTITVQLAGDVALPIAGIALVPEPLGVLSGFSGSDEAREFDILLSTDGTTFTPVYSGTLSPLPKPQYVVFDESIEAAYAQLVIHNNYGGNEGSVIIGEWQVIASPGVMPSGVDRLNIANPGLGGHYVRATPNLQDLTIATSMLDDTLDRVGDYVQEGAIPSLTIGFAHNRAAQLDGFEWIDSPDSDPDNVFKSVEISVSLDSPSGPWKTVGTWELDRANASADQPISFDFDEPVWARFVRFTSTVPAPGGGQIWDFPATLRAFERPTDDDYQSVAAEWGWNSPAGIYEKLNPPVLETFAPETTANDTPEQAQPLTLGETARGAAQIGKDVDWYEVDVPQGMDQLEFTVTGKPAVDVVLTVIDDQGNDVPMTTSTSAADVIVFTAPVTPGETYKVKIEQPQHSVVFAFDTSGSIGNFFTQIYASLTVFASEVVPGQEQVNFLPFGEAFLLDNWEDEPFLLQTAINNYPRTAADSNSPKAVLNATQQLAGQPGAKAIMLITDADTSLGDQGEAWTALDGARPRIFGVQVAAMDARNPQERAMMEDWALVNNGYFGYAATQGDIDVAFDRVATWLRRPAAYTVTTEAIQAPTPTPSPSPTPSPTPTPTPTPTLVPTATPSEPGRVYVVPPKREENEPVLVAENVAVEIVFDTSGSMLQPLEGSTRADVAKTTLIDLVTNTIPAGTPLALRIFGQTPDSCETSLAVPLQPLDPVAMSQTIQQVPIVNLVKTPLGESLRQVGEDLQNVDGPKIIVLVTDGEETCGGDAEAAIRELVNQGIDVHVNIVGFALDDQALKDTFDRWARIGNGVYVDAANAEELEAAVETAVQAPFRVLDANGNVVATGVVGGGSVAVPPGTYTVEVLTDPTGRVEGIEVQSGERTRVELEDE